MRLWGVVSGVAWRTLKNVLTTPSLLLPSLAFPLFFFVAFAGGLSQVQNVPGFEFPDGYTAFQFVFVLLQSAAFGGVFTGFGVARDFEGGFAIDPQEVAANVKLAAATGIAGLSIEDASGDAEHPLFDFTLAVERIRAAREAIDASGTGVLLTGRSEGFLCGRPDIDETVRRLRAYAEAGADCLYAPRISTAEQIKAIVAAVAPKPVNLLINAPFVTVAEAAALGVRRISVGGTLARTAWAGFLQAAREIKDAGTFSCFQQLPNVDALLGG